MGLRQGCQGMRGQFGDSGRDGVSYLWALLLYKDSVECVCVCVCVSVCVCVCARMRLCVCFRSSSGNNSVKNSGSATELGTRVEL